MQQVESAPMERQDENTSAATGWGFGWLWAAVGLAGGEPEPEPEPQTEAQLAAAVEEGGSGSSGSRADDLTAAEQQRLPGVGDKAAQTEQLLVRLVGDWDVSGNDDISGFLSLDEKIEDGEPRTLVGELSLGDASFEVYDVAAVSLPSATVWVSVATGELEHVYAEFEGRLELRLPEADSGTRLEISLVMDAPEGHSGYHVAGDMSASQIRLEWYGLEGVRAK